MERLFSEVESLITWIAGIGEDLTGGTSRFLYDENWVKAQQGLKEKFEQAGFGASFDSIGNLFGTVKGEQYPDETILTGSHVDTVPNGGKLDGQFGILAGYLAIKYLLETYGKPKRSLQVVSFAEEESSRFSYGFWGSKNLFCLAKREDVENIYDQSGINFVEAMENAGFNFKLANEKMRSDLKGYIEVHIEQGVVLERNNQSVGIVNAIVGQKRYMITLKGEANHVGTTSMGYRKDALYGYSKICTQLTGKAITIGDPLVITFGRINALPNATNVVAGEVVFSIDCRHPDGDALNNFAVQAQNDIKQIATELGLEIKLEVNMDEQPVPMDETITNMLQQVCIDEKTNYRVMRSGAGHDAQVVAPHVPAGMVFVPSMNGISHSPLEDTKTEDLVEGVKVLIHALHKLAY